VQNSYESPPTSKPLYTRVNNMATESRPRQNSQLSLSASLCVSADWCWKGENYCSGVCEGYTVKIKKSSFGWDGGQSYIVYDYNGFLIWLNIRAFLQIFEICLVTKSPEKCKKCPDSGDHLELHERAGEALQPDGPLHAEGQPNFSVSIWCIFHLFRSVIFQ
jgi:hypothetical protein